VSRSRKHYGSSVAKLDDNPYVVAAFVRPIEGDAGGEVASTKPLIVVCVASSGYVYLVKLNGALRRLVSELNTVTCTVWPSDISCSSCGSRLITCVVKPPSCLKSAG